MVRAGKTPKTVFLGGAQGEPSSVERVGDPDFFFGPKALGWSCLLIFTSFARQDMLLEVFFIIT